MRLPLDQIIVRRSDRIRKEITEADIEEKAESMARIGQINPITVNRDTILNQHQLVAGETRYLAAHLLGWPDIEVRFYEDLDEFQKLEIEIEENVKRKDLSWQDQCDALHRYHQMHLKDNAEWRQQDTAQAIGMTQANVSKLLAVADELAAGNTKIASLPKFSTAREIVKRNNERKAADQAAQLLAIEQPEVEAEKEKKKAASPILTANFHEWAKEYRGVPFNFLHVDFPYGINSDVGSPHKQYAAKSLGGYSDTRDDHLALCDTLYTHRHRLMGESAHMIFWFSMHYYQETLEWLRSWLWVDPFPLIWAKTAGIIPNPNMNPRRCYETAFLCSWPKENPRKIISAVANWSGGKLDRQADHMSEKNTDMLGHFFRMVVDANTRMLDPTCGSASALRAARAAGAGMVLGLEVNEDYAKQAREAWENDVVFADV
jgi:ParB/RepB/Spo0J family partition protein